MVEFMSGYTSAMDASTPVKPTEDVTFDIEKPIIPIGEIGTTSVDAGQGNILQNLENNIRMGTKKIQIVFTPGRGGISSGPTSYGKQVRQSLAEKAKATGVDIVGVELSPAMISGLAGLDRQSGRISEEQRQKDMNQVRDAIRFAADVSKGGCVDLWSQEFQRNIYDASWNTEKNVDGKENKWKGQFFSSSPDELKKDDPDALAKLNIVKYLIDKRTGEPLRGSQVKVGDSITEVKWQTAKDFKTLYGRDIVGSVDANGHRLAPDDPVDYQGNYLNPNLEKNAGKLVPYIDPKTHDFQVQEVKWDDIRKRTDEWNKANKAELTPEEFLYKQRLLNQKSQVEGQSLYYSRNLDRSQQTMHELSQLRGVAADLQKSMSDEQKRQFIKDTLIPKIASEEGLPAFERERLMRMQPTEVVEDLMRRQENQIRAMQEQATTAKINAQEYEEIAKNITTPFKYARERSFQSYAEMGIEAMRVTKERKLDKPVYIGPEIGWAGEMYGGHPQEFKELILKSRDEMAKRLKDQGYTESAAKDAAKNHIKGMLDTSHMMMWYKHFNRKKGEDDEKHIKRFNEWLVEQTRDLVKAGVVGGVQVVDSITGEHSHLPAGQGAFDVVGMVKAMKEEGFKGPIISEGHEEDTGGFGQGRILTETWRAFGSPIGNYAPGQKGGLRSWGGMQHSYFGHTNPTTYVVGAYVPSNEWSLWSETPFE